MKVSIFLCSLLSLAAAKEFLTVSDGDIKYNGEKVFLSGMNVAWQQYGNDFGNGQYDCCTGAPLQKVVREISRAGGNSLRMWLHCSGDTTPVFDSNGFVISTDATNTFIDEFVQFVDYAQKSDVFVVPVLWNMADLPNSNVIGLVMDDAKLDSYLEVVLRPLVRAVKDRVGLAAWKIINEPEGSVVVDMAAAEPCFDTTPLAGSGAGWNGADIPMERMLRFINRQIAVIKEEDPKALATVGSWSEKSSTDLYGFRNYYSDRCLVAAGGEATGTVDFYQMHTIQSPLSPLAIHNSAFKLDKPHVIGKFSQTGGDGRDITGLVEHAYRNGYSGAWTWQARGTGRNADDLETQIRGLRHLAGRNGPGGKINFHLLA